MIHTPMSEAIMRVAQTILRNAETPPAEIALLSLVLAHAAWNESLGLKAPPSFFAELKRIESSNPGIWKHFRPTNASAAISDLIVAKKRLFPHDNREIVSSQMSREGKIRAEWRMVGAG